MVVQENKFQQHLEIPVTTFDPDAQWTLAGGGAGGYYGVPGTATQGTGGAGGGGDGGTRGTIGGNGLDGTGGGGGSATVGSSDPLVYNGGFWWFWYRLNCISFLINIPQDC